MTHGPTVVPVSPTARTTSRTCWPLTLPPPTRTYWTRAGADPVAAATHLRQITGASDDVLIVAASGYGAYGMRADVLEVPVLCAIEQIAHTAGVPCM